MELKDIIAQNITELRKQNKMTQAELAERLNYTDKAISKWERGESIPEVGTLKQIAEIFNCTVDVLLTENATQEIKKYAIPRNVRINHRIIAAAASLVIWIIAIVIFVYSYVYLSQERLLWDIFMWAIPVNCIVLYVLCYRYRTYKPRVYIASLFLWSLLGSIYYSTYVYQTWMIFIIGLPIQALIILLHCLKK